MLPRRETGRLRSGRLSVSGETYFITACTASRVPLLAVRRRAVIARDAMLSLAAGGDVEWIAGTVMPDHIHVLFELGRRLSLDRVLAKLKGGITRQCGLGGAFWQENVYEHRLRPKESLENYALYIYMNPYRAGVCALGDTWPWWVCTLPQRFEFCGKLRSNGSPQPEWLTEVEKLAAGIYHGE